MTDVLVDGLYRTGISRSPQRQRDTETKEETADEAVLSQRKRRLLTSTSTLSCDSAEFDESFGLLIKLGQRESLSATGSASSSSDGPSRADNTRSSAVAAPSDQVCTLTFVADENVPSIHPHVYCPSDWRDHKRLGGGGSGVAVFSAHAPSLQKHLVLKHGGFKDLKELFALATIARELQQRGGLLPDGPDTSTNNDSISNINDDDVSNASPPLQLLPLQTSEERRRVASQNMQKRIPRFECIYISPRHLRDRNKYLWKHLRSIIDRWSKPHKSSIPASPRATWHPSPVTRKTVKSIPQTPPPTPMGSTRDVFECPEDELPTQRRSMLFLSPSNPATTCSDCQWEQNSVRLCSSSEDVFQIEMEGNDKDSIAFCLAQNSYDWIDSKTIQLHGSAYDSLQHIVKQLLPLMQDRLFKFTLGQRSIGGPSPTTGNTLLYNGQMKGDLLERFLDLFLESIKDLQYLTQDDEVDVVDRVRNEVKRIETSKFQVFADDLDSLADSFVGKSIKKNFRSNGRMELLYELGLQFREFNPDAPAAMQDDAKETDLLVLTAEEIFPARLLGRLLRPGALMGDSFEDVPMEPATMHYSEHYWRNLLSRAVSTKRKPSALRRIWTSGLADAGLHNLFFDAKNNRIYFFDLGEPELQSVPGFLTKFLFSFFHTLGMQEGEDGNWIRRFDRKGDKLVATAETLDLLSLAYNAFERTLERIIRELFEGDDSLRWLLIQYVTLQLLSDAAFCLQRWQVKGGGRSRETNHHRGIEQWLWRALWDVYIAYDINTQDAWARLKVVHPLHCGSSLYERSSGDMDDDEDEFEDGLDHDGTKEP